MSMFNYSSLEECLPGYHGPLCNMTCRYPNYGEDCQLKCLCEEEQCDHISGCVWKSNIFAYSVCFILFLSIDILQITMRKKMLYDHSYYYLQNVITDIIRI